MRPATRRIVGWALAAAGAAVVIAVVAFLAWALTPLGPTESALAALESDARVAVAETPEGFTFTPASGETTRGAILYPGGRVDVRSYAPLAREIAERGFVVVLVPMPLSLAVIDPDAAAGVIAAHPEIETWTLGGHSLGGAMAAGFVAAEPDSVDGLVLLAAYPAEGTDLSARDVAAATIVGTEDGLVDATTFEESLERLPKQTVPIVLEGGNHAQFGDYGPQPGDGSATMPPDTQRRMTADAFEDIALRAAAPSPDEP